MPSFERIQEAFCNLENFFLETPRRRKDPPYDTFKLKKGQVLIRIDGAAARACSKNKKNLNLVEDFGRHLYFRCGIYSTVYKRFPDRSQEEIILEIPNHRSSVARLEEILQDVVAERAEKKLVGEFRRIKKNIAKTLGSETGGVVLKRAAGAALRRARIVSRSKELTLGN